MSAKYGCISERIRLNSTSFTLIAMAERPNSMSIIEYDANGNFLKRTHGNQVQYVKITEIMPATVYIAAQISDSNGGTTITPNYVSQRNMMLVEGTNAPIAYEPYHSSTTNYEFGVLGKNKFNWDVEESQSTPVSSGAETARTFALNTYVVGMSINNYYRQNYANWVLNPSVSNGVISFSSNAARGYGIAFPLKLAAGQTYFLSGTGDGTVGATYYNEDGELISYQNGRLNKTITVPENAVTTLIGFYASASNTDFTFSNIQLELGSTATTYEPYNSNHTVYGGWVDLVSGEAAEEYAAFDLQQIVTKKQVFSSFTLWFSDALSILGIDLTPSGNANFTGWCDYYKIMAYTSTFQKTDNAISVRSDSNRRAIYVRTDGTDEITPEGTAILKLATPNTYQIAPTSLQTFLGQNNVWSNADYVEVEYDLHETQNILARKQFIVANQPHIVKPAAAPLQFFTTDMAVPLKECKIEFKPVQDLYGYSKPWVGGAGKNLFNINASMQDPSDTTLSNTTKRIFTPNTYSVGASYSNWWQPNKITDYSISNNSITVTSSTGYGVCFAIKAKPETYYTVSATVVGNNPRINNAYYDSEGNYLGSATTGGNITTFQTPENTDMMVIIFAPVNNTEATFSNIQVEEGQTATAYEPWENVCPISGWTELEAYKTGKSLARFADSVGPTNRYYNGFSGWLLDGYWKIPDRTQTYTYSVYIDNRNAESDSCVNVWFRNETNTAYVRTVNGSKVKAGETGWSTLTFHNSNYYFAGLGISLQIGGVAKSGIVEIGDTTSAYEPYSGETIPMTFPSVINILNSTTITANKTLSAAGEEISESGMSLTNYIKVNEGDTYKLTFTSKEGARTRRIYGYDVNKEPVESLAAASWVTVDTTYSLQATIPAGTEYIRVCYKTADENIFLEGPESSTFYGGYVDLTTGEIWETYHHLSVTAADVPKRRSYSQHESSQTSQISWFTENAFKAPNPTLYVAGSTDGFCSHIPFLVNNFAYSPKCQANNTTVDLRIAGLLTIEEFTTWMEKNGPIDVVYPVRTPFVVATLTPQQLKALRGTNNIWSSSNGDIEVQYWIH